MFRIRNSSDRRPAAPFLGVLLILASVSALADSFSYDIRGEYWVDGPNSVQPGSDRGAPAVAVGPNGVVVHVWEAFTSNRHDIFLQRFDRSDQPIGGSPPPPQLVNTLTDDDQRNPRIAIRGDGSFYIVWQSDDLGDNENWVRGQLFDSDGVAQGNELRISELSSGATTDVHATVAALNDGSFVATWTSFNGFGSDSQPCLPGVPPGCETPGIQARRINSTGSAVGSQFQINDEVDSTQRHPSVVSTVDGGFVVFWQSSSGNDGDPSSFSIQGRRFSASGSPQGGDFQVNTTTAGSQAAPEAAMDSGGRLMVVFESPNSTQSETSVRARLYDRDLSALGDDFLVPDFEPATDQFDPRIAGGLDYFLIAWTVFGGVGSDTDFAVNGRIAQGSDQFESGQFQINVYEPASQLVQAVGAYGSDAIVSWRSTNTTAFESDDGIIARGFAFDRLFADRFESP